MKITPHHGLSLAIAALVGASAATIDAQSQLVNNLQGMMSSRQELLADAVENAYFLTCQDFLVADKQTGELYGYENGDIFGRVYSIGVKIKDGFVLTAQTQEPWDYDAKYPNYKDDFFGDMASSTWTAVGSSTPSYTSLSEEIDLPWEKTDSLIIPYTNKNLFAGEGLSVDLTPGEKNGWIVWVTTANIDALQTTLDLSLIPIRKSLVAGAQPSEVETPMIDRQVVGGFYIVPVTDGMGTITIKLCGLVVPPSNDRQSYLVGWLCPLDEAQAAAVAPAQAAPAAEATPADAKGGNKKDALTPVKPAKGKGKKK
ncbi:MAG: hypothetical protein LIO90_07525 [Bacteroidales bacterium]|nr:hypothetical protein [Bacteroidales bacterium]